MLRYLDKILIGLGLTFSVVTYGQDTQFSQIERVPMLQNPANSGMGKGYNRANLLTQQLYPNVDNSFKTMYASVDAQILNKVTKSKKSLLGGGFYVYNSKAGASNFSKLQAGLSLSSIINIDYYTKMSFALQGVFQQNSVSTANIKWDSQFDGLDYNAYYPSFENYTGAKTTFFNMSAGGLFQHFSREENFSGIDKGSFQIGYAAFNLLRPSVDFLGMKDNLYIKHLIHFKSLFAIGNERFGLVPLAQAQIQGPHFDFVAGGNLIYFMKADTKYTGFIKEAYIGFGLKYRNTDAIIANVNFKIQNFLISGSYDFGISKIGQLNNRVGGFEISIQYNDTYGTLFNQGNKHITNSSRGKRHL